MRAVIQRVGSACVKVDDRVVGAIGHGLLVLLGIAADDTEADARWLLEKLLDLRIFENAVGKFDRSVREVNGALLVVSQFTLYADTRKGRRPSFTEAARPEHAMPLYECFVAAARAHGVSVATGEFGAHMQVELVNDGPVTLTLDSRAR
jgi:D-tyrosyl-tRNA(Tyr) deacylase